MKKHISKRVAALLMAMLMVIGLMPTVVSAATDPWLIDPAKDGEGSVEIVKEIATPRIDSEGDPVLDGQGNPMVDYAKVEGVEFYQWKVADIKQVLLADGSVSIGYTNLNPVLLTAFGEAPVVNITELNVHTTVTGTYYDATSLQTALRTKFGVNQAPLRNIIKTNGEKMDLTDASGVTKAEDLDLGLYLFVETAWPAEITSPCEPFFISVPSNVTADLATHDTNVEVDKWLYDITAIPKNQKQTINMDKWILTGENAANDSSDDKLSKGEDYTIGDTVPYRIEADVPDSIALLKTYTIGDMLSAGLTFDGASTVKVYGEKASGPSVPLVAGTHYTVSTVAADQFVVIDNENGANVGNSTFVVKFDPQSFVGALDGIKKVFIEYTATLNEEAKIYEDGNPNYSSLIYSKNTGLDNTPDELVKVKPQTPEPIVYTYKVAINKALEAPEGATPYAGITFRLEDHKGDPIKVGLDGAESGTPIYRVGKLETKALPTDPDVLKDDAIAVNPTTGKVIIVGLGAGQYQLAETSTAPKHTLLEKAIIFTIQATFTGEDFDANAKGNYFRIEANREYLADGKPVDLTGFSVGDHIKVAGVITATDGDPVVKYVHFTDESGYVPPALNSNYDVNTFNFVEFTILNKVGITPPHTGGMGTYIFTVVGALIIGAALLLISKKKKVQE